MDRSTHYRTHERGQQVPRNPYLRCVEYMCVIDIIFKIFTLFMPYTSYVKNNRMYWGEGCHQLYGFSRILNMSAKFYSLVVSFIGIRAAWYYDLRLFTTFRRQFMYYCLLELFILLFVVLEIGLSNCSNVAVTTRLTYACGVLLLGLIFLSVYYALWMWIIGKSTEYLQNSDQKILGEEMPHSFQGYGSVGDKAE